MAIEGSLSHRFKDEPGMEARAREVGANINLIAENLAVASKIAEVHQQWMDSTEDRTKWMSPEVDIVGIAVVASHGMFYAVADYARAVHTLSQPQVEATIASLLRAKGFAIVQNATDARTICVGRHFVSTKPSAVFVLQASDLTLLPESLLKLLVQGHFRKASVGSCPAGDLDGRINQYRVAVLLYSVGVGVY
jgi:hypothetical protein